MYYKAKQKALDNGQVFHLAAVLLRGKHVVKIGTNSDKTHPRFKRTYKDGSCRSHLHAEMDVLRFAKPGDEIYVFRFSAEGDLTMAKPCRFCEKFIRDTKIKRVYYSDWSGNIVHMNP